ncbi:MAG TPA: HEAT repeat domain-containing protein [Thermoanaerobaculia bacterium]|nr:HEAT repeat domain-containing protein [Thermoanaerobaculia bacterium]
MRTLLAALLLIAAPAFAQNPLRDAVSQGATSIAWKIQTHGVYICCCNDRNITINHGDSRIEYEQIYLIARIEDGRIDKVRMVEPTCPLTGTRLIENVTPDASLDFLLDHLGDDDDRVVTSIAMHDHPRVIPELSRLARHHERKKVRREAIFWLGQRAGEKAAGELRRAVDEDPEDEVREHAVFAISQLPRERAVPLLVDLVKTHKRPAVRKRAMFWLAQTGDQRALDLIEEILGVR